MVSSVLAFSCCSFGRREHVGEVPEGFDRYIAIHCIASVERFYLHQQLGQQSISIIGAPTAERDFGAHAQAIIKFAGCFNRPLKGLHKPTVGSSGCRFVPGKQFHFSNACLLRAALKFSSEEQDKTKEIKDHRGSVHPAGSDRCFSVRCVPRSFGRFCPIPLIVLTAHRTFDRYATQKNQSKSFIYRVVSYRTPRNVGDCSKQYLRKLREPSADARGQLQVDPMLTHKPVVRKET